MVLAFVLVLYMAIVLLKQFYDAVPDAGSPPTFDLIKASIRSLIPFIPIPIITYYVGCQRQGSKRRLVSRIILNMYLIVSIILFSDSLSYSVNDLVVSKGMGIATDHIMMSRDITMLTIPLFTIPVCSMIDAVLESRMKT